MADIVQFPVPPTAHPRVKAAYDALIKASADLVTTALTELSTDERAKLVAVADDAWATARGMLLREVTRL